MPRKATLNSLIFLLHVLIPPLAKGASSREMAAEVQTLVWPSCATSWWNDNTGARSGRAPLAKRGCWLTLPQVLPQGAASGLRVLTLATLPPALGVAARGLATGHRPDAAAGCGHHPPGGRPRLAGRGALCQRPAAGAALHPAAAAHGCCGAAGMQVMLSCPSPSPCGPFCGAHPYFSISSCVSLSRASLARLHTAGFPDILDCNQEPVEISEPVELGSFNLRLEEADPLQGNEIVLQFLAFGRWDGSSWSCVGRSQRPPGQSPFPKFPRPASLSLQRCLF